MSALEDEILAKLRLLDKDARKRVIELAQNEIDAPEPFDYKAWWEKTDTLREAIRSELGEGEFVNSLALLHEAREERP